MYTIASTVNTHTRTHSRSRVNMMKSKWWLIWLESFSGEEKLGEGERTYSLPSLYNDKFVQLIMKIESTEKRTTSTDMACIVYVVWEYNVWLLVCMRAVAYASKKSHLLCCSVACAHASKWITNANVKVWQQEQLALHLTVYTIHVSSESEDQCDSSVFFCGIYRRSN